VGARESGSRTGALSLIGNISLSISTMAAA
jgi:hypothetical protein